jgi:DNA-binding GntR family transcriptional regulator
MTSRQDAVAAISLSIERLSTATRVAEALREELLSGTLPPGTPMRDVELSARAGVSRTTVREALAQLAREGLLSHSLHRGMEVARLAPADVRDIYAARRVIERAGSEALLTGDAAALAEMDLAVQAMRAATAAGDRRRVVEADVAFHTAIGAATGVRRLRAALAGALGELRLVLSVTDRASGDLDDQLRQHHDLLVLFRARDAAVLPALAEHLRQAEEQVCVALEVAGADGVRLPAARGAAASIHTGDERSPAL